MSLTPRSQRIALQVWAYCEPRGWDCTHAEVAEGIGESVPSVRAVCQHKKWSHRLRVTEADDYRHRTVGYVERQLGDLNQWS